MQRSANVTGWRNLREREQGQIAPALLLLVIAMMAGGLTLFVVGRATAMQAEAQTGADAAALAGAEELQRQLYSFDRPDPGLVDWLMVRGAVESYGARNDVDIVSFSHVGLDVIVEANTDEALDGRYAEDLDADGERGWAEARARVAVFQVPFASVGGSSIQIPPPADAPEFVRRAWNEANRIDGMSLPYLWGGGHQSSPAPANGPFDCSGAVSRVLQAAGLPIPTMVSGQFTSVGKPGPGRVTIYANDGHVYMSIDGRFFGTGGSNPGGGAGWLDPYSARPGFVVRHIPLEGDFVPENLVGVGAGFTQAAFAATFDVMLVPMDGSGPGLSPQGNTRPRLNGTGGLGDPNDPATWEALAQCESSGNWQANTGNGFYGGLQFTLQSWEAAGGQGMPHEASKAEQIARAQRLQELQGWGAWPTCAPRLGFG